MFPKFETPCKLDTRSDKRREGESYPFAAFCEMSPRGLQQLEGQKSLRFSSDWKAHLHLYSKVL